MRVIGFVGSPRKNGNTDVLVRRILEGAAAGGADTEVFYLNDLNIRGCQACMYCKTHDGCKQEDDMARLIEEVRKADGFVFGSPIYIGYISGQAKAFIDRLYVFLTGPDTPSKVPPGKKSAVVFSQGNPDPAVFSKGLDIIPFFFEQRLGTKQVDTLIAAGVPDAAGDEALMQRALQIGSELAR